jgi:putative outer membrane protein, probably involved in nutrient binding
LYDIKRWNLGVVRGAPQNVAAIFSTPADEYYQLNISAGNYKLTWPIPATDISFEKGKWQQNPGW